jgi:hypothetical protein
MSVPPVVDLSAATADAVRELNHLTLHHFALGGPGDLDRVVAELAITAGRLPQLLRQLSRWAEVEQAAGRLRSDSPTGPDLIVSAARCDLATAADAAGRLGVALDAAHQQFARLGARPSRAETATEPGCGRRLAGRDGC